MIETPIDAISWLKQKSKRVRIGKDDYTDIANVIRALVFERSQLQRQLDNIEKVAAIATHKLKQEKEAKKRAFGTEGNGPWDFDNPRDRDSGGA